MSLNEYGLSFGFSQNAATQSSPAPVIKSFASFADASSGDLALERRILSVLQEAFALWCQRHRKYGRGNISEWGSLGCLVRASDKKARLREHYTGTIPPDVDKGESVEDAWLDMLNYAAMGLLCHRKRWDVTERALSEGMIL